MEQDESFDILCESTSEDEDLSSVSRISQVGVTSSSRKKIVVNRRNATSSKKSSSSFGSHIVHLSPKKKHQTSLGCKIKLKEIAKSSSSYKLVSTFDAHNGSDELDFENSGSILGDSDVTDSLDGYESGVASKSINKWYLCKACTHLYKKATKAKDAEQIPKKPDPSHWCSKFWMMISQNPSQKEHTRRKEPNRALKNVVRKLRSGKLKTKLQLRCSRIHSFLNRNLRLCLKTKKLMNMPKVRRKRKRMASVPMSQAKKRKESVPSNFKSKAFKKTYTYVLDSSEEECPVVKKYRRKGEDREIKNSENLVPSVSRRKPCSRLVSTAACSGLQAAAQDDYALPPVQWSDSQDSSSSVDATSSPFAHVQSGGFRELLERLNSGYPGSGIVNENRI